MIYTITLNPALDKEYTVSRLEFDEVLRADTVKVNYGGKGFNVSRMLASLGSSSIALGFIGGETGRIIQNGLAAAGIETDFTQVAGETRTNVSIVSETEKRYIKVNEPGPRISEEEVERLMLQVDARVIRKVQAGGAFALLDTSGPALEAGLQAHPCLIKPNIKEVSQLIKKEVSTLADMEAVLPDLHAYGIDKIVISAGKQGALISNGREHWFKPAPVIQERNPIGAGDAMVAGLVWRLSLNDEPQSALAWAIACGTAAASLPGTDMPPKTQVEGFLYK